MVNHRIMPQHKLKTEDAPISYLSVNCCCLEKHLKLLHEAESVFVFNNVVFSLNC